MGIDDPGAVGPGEDGLFERFSHFSSIDIESSSYLNVPRLVTSDFEVHKPKGNTVSILVAAFPVKFNPLEKRTGTISNTYNSYSDRMLRHNRSAFPKFTSTDSKLMLLSYFTSIVKKFGTKNSFNSNHFS